MWAFQICRTIGNGGEGRSYSHPLTQGALPGLVHGPIFYGSGPQSKPISHFLLVRLTECTSFVAIYSYLRVIYFKVILRGSATDCRLRSRSSMEIPHADSQETGSREFEDIT